MVRFGEIKRGKREISVVPKDTPVDTEEPGHTVRSRGGQAPSRARR